MCIFRTTSVWACNRIRLCPHPSSSSSSFSHTQPYAPSHSHSHFLQLWLHLELCPSLSISLLNSSTPIILSWSSTLFDYAPLISVNVCEYIHCHARVSAGVRICVSVCVWGCVCECVCWTKSWQRLAGDIARRRRRCHCRYMWHIHTNTLAQTHSCTYQLYYVYA